MPLQNSPHLIQVSQWASSSGFSYLHHWWTLLSLGLMLLDLFMVRQCQSPHQWVYMQLLANYLTSFCSCFGPLPYWCWGHEIISILLCLDSLSHHSRGWLLKTDVVAGGASSPSATPSECTWIYITCDFADNLLLTTPVTRHKGMVLYLHQCRWTLYTRYFFSQPSLKIRSWEIK